MNSEKRLFWKRAVSIGILLVFALTLASPAVNTTPGGDSYIVTGQNIDEVSAAVGQVGGTVVETFSSITGVQAYLTTVEAQQLRDKAGVDSVFPDSDVQLQGDGDWGEEGGLDALSPTTDYPDVTGADQVWAQGVTGAGVTVAVLDTGIGLHRGVIRGIDEKS